MEKWSPIPDTHYSVSSEGKVRNDETNVIKVLSKDTTGYYKTDLYSEGVRQSKRVHRLVAEAFIPNPDGKPQVNHIDGNKLNNNVENLEWVNNSENMIHAYNTGLATPHPTYGMRGKKNPIIAMLLLQRDNLAYRIVVYLIAYPVKVVMHMVTISSMQLKKGGSPDE